MGKRASFFTHERPSIPRRFHRPPASLSSSDREGKNGMEANWLPAAKRLRTFSLPRFSWGKLKRLPRLSRCAAASLREDIVKFDYLPDNFKSSLDNCA
jgi:hypothetical protein